MYCSSCGAAVAQGLSYCNFCGAKLGGARGDVAAAAVGVKPELLVSAMMGASSSASWRLPFWSAC